MVPHDRGTLKVSETPGDIATAVSPGDFFLPHAPLVVGRPSGNLAGKFRPQAALGTEVSRASAF